MRKGWKVKCHSFISYPYICLESSPKDIKGECAWENMASTTLRKM
jgi:hypothetical protein